MKFNDKITSGQISFIIQKYMEIRTSEIRRIHNPNGFFGLRIYTTNEVVNDDNNEETEQVVYFAFKHQHEGKVYPQYLKIDESLNETNPILNRNKSQLEMIETLEELFGEMEEIKI